MSEVLIRNGSLVMEREVFKGNILVQNGRLVTIGPSEPCGSVAVCAIELNTAGLYVEVLQCVQSNLTRLAFMWLQDLSISR